MTSKSTKSNFSLPSNKSSLGFVTQLIKSQSSSSRNKINCAKLVRPNFTNFTKFGRDLKRPGTSRPSTPSTHSDEVLTYFRFSSPCEPLRMSSSFYENLKTSSIPQIRKECIDSKLRILLEMVKRCKEKFREIRLLELENSILRNRLKENEENRGEFGLLELLKNRVDQFSGKGQDLSLSGILCEKDVRYEDLIRALSVKLINELRMTEVEESRV